MQQKTLPEYIDLTGKLRMRFCISRLIDTGHYGDRLLLDFHFYICVSAAELAVKSPLNVPVGIYGKGCGLRVNYARNVKVSDKSSV